MIKAITFDFWNTIAEPNPQYTEARTAYLADLFGCDLFEAKKHYTKIKKHFDTMSERWGNASTPLNCIESLISGKKLTRSATVADIYFDFIHMVAKYPPYISAELDQLLRRLSTVMPIAIISNTNFIPGIILKTYLPDVFSWYSFSDQLGFAKPSQNIFQYTINGVNEVTQRGLRPDNFLHIGDNLCCDVQGAEKAGMLSTFVKDPTATVYCVDEFLKKGYFE